MRRWIRWIDWVLYLGIPAFITVLIAITPLWPQPWPAVKIAFAFGVPLAAWVTGVGILITMWRQRPTFVTAQGTHVWAKGVAGVTPLKITHALGYYVGEVSRRYAIAQDDMTDMVNRAGIEITSDRFRFGEREYAGLQKGRRIKVAWLDGPRTNALFHELHHMADEIVLKRAVDYKHTRVAWWDSIPELKRNYSG